MVSERRGRAKSDEDQKNQNSANTRWHRNPPLGVVDAKHTEPRRIVCPSQAKHQCEVTCELTLHRHDRRVRTFVYRRSCSATSPPKKTDEFSRSRGAVHATSSRSQQTMA